MEFTISASTNSTDETPTVDKSSYFEKLVGSLSRIASHSYYPGKEDTVEQCLEEIEEIRLSGRITAEQSATLRELLLGEEPLCLLEGALRVQSRDSETAKPTKIAVTCQGDGSHAAFSAGVLQGLLEQDGDYGEIAAIGGMSYGAISPCSPGMACSEEILRGPQTSSRGSGRTIPPLASSTPF